MEQYLNMLVNYLLFLILFLGVIIFTALFLNSQLQEQEDWKPWALEDLNLYGYPYDPKSYASAIPPSAHKNFWFKIVDFNNQKFLLGHKGFEPIT